MVTGRAGHDVLVACAPVTAAARHGHLLSAEESARAAAFAPRRAQEFTAGRALLRWALGRSLGSWARTCRIGVTERGKPVLADLPATGISVSHGGGATAVAVAVGRAVGVDTQPPVPPTPGLLRRCCSPEQQRELATLPSERQPAALARRWTIHEALVKATGQGLSRRPGGYPGPLLVDSGRWQHLGWQTLPPVGSCAVTVAYDGPGQRPTVRYALVEDLDTVP